MTKKYTVEIPASIIKNSFYIALNQSPEKRGNFFSDVRIAFKRQIENILHTHGILTFPESTLGNTNYLRDSRQIPGCNLIKTTGFGNDIRKELDMRFCAGYGHDDYSLQAINYMDRVYHELPSLLPFIKINNFSLGNILVLVDNGDYEIDLNFELGVHVTGYAHQISLRKRKSYLCLFGIHFENAILNDFYEGNKSCNHDLDEVKIGMISYPFLSICRRCGQLFTCSCFQGYYTIAGDLVRYLPHGNSEKILQNYVENIQVKDGICNLCTNTVPSKIYGSYMYYSSFLQRYLPYHTLFSRKKFNDKVYDDVKIREIENEVRDAFGYPRIGEKWISETILFNIVRTMFNPMEVIHHYRGVELEGLEIDIWIPEILLGIEYQGEQHYKSIPHWGGESGLKKRQENDKKKKILCKKVGYTLIEFQFSENLSEDAVRKKLSRYLS